MEHSFLIANSLYKIGAQIGKCISGIDIEVELINGSFQAIGDKLAEKRFDGFIFFIQRMSDEAINFVAEIRGKYKDMKIYPLIFTGSEYVRQDLIRAGASLCFIMPYMPPVLSGELLCHFYNNRNYKIIPQIVYFLNSKGFDSSFQGFYPLCIAISMLLNSPDKLNGSITDFYRELADFINSKYENVERNLRTIIRKAFKKGIVINNSKPLFRMKNKELLLLLTEEYKGISKNSF